MKPMIDVVQKMLDGQAERYKNAVDGLPEEALNWRPGDQTTNSVAQLVRHVTAVQTVLLASALGESPEHNHEYSLRNDPATAEELRGLIAAAKAKKDEQLARLDALDMSEMIPRQRGPVMRAYLVIHTADHGQEHLGHAELAKQLWEQRGQTA
ncbi:MAG: DinB family protein [Thermomicrobia bacterium]|nr:DinB family protein [Thermomicrobia bacterium]